MKRVFGFMIVISLLAPLGARAADDEAPKKTKKAKKESLHDQVTGQGYGLAGCGLGSIVFGPKPGMIQVVAATLNGTGHQTFAITTGTSNCDIPEMGQQAAVFIEVNRDALAKDASRGQGETVAGLAYILKCSDPAVFGEGLRQNFGRIFDSSNDSYDATREILKTIKNSQTLQASCATLG